MDSSVITISDSGPGIPREAAAKLFDPFFQAHHPQDSGSQGLGLGLAIVKHLVELHKGSIAVQSEPGKGTQFLVTLPIQRKDTRAKPVLSST